jgi:outer membrane protein OmpA-like peptidoglycan-associated protein/ABC-type nitrate/sulfonate/bicarbonate transport system substrate-binding protein
MPRLTLLSKFMITAIAFGSIAASLHTYRLPSHPGNSAAGVATREKPFAEPALSSTGSLPVSVNAVRTRMKVAVSQWPGHMALLVGAGGLSTQPGSIAAGEGLDFEVVFLEDAASKNEALRSGAVDFVWQTVDELPINLAGYRAANVDVRAFLQIDWSRGGDACVASKEVTKVEDIIGRKSAMLLFSPDHTVFEFMITNSRLSPAQVSDARKATQFSPDDFTFARQLFAAGKVDVACLWEPDVTLALAARPGSHRLFSTADATELVADVLLAKREYLDRHAAEADKLARVWFKAVAQANRDRPAAARLISSVASRFRDELGYEKTLKALNWAKWTTLPDNVHFFGLDGGPASFDRVYNQADSIWINYPEAEIKDRFAPSVLRDDRAVRRIWEAAGKPVAVNAEPYDGSVAQSGAALFTKPVSINFGMGDATLSAEALAVINQQILPELLIARGMYARVEGNTDGIGDRDANKGLSERRAWTIVEYLASKGVARARLVARGNGAANPVATNATAEGRALNRRTDVLFIRGAKE